VGLPLPAQLRIEEPDKFHCFAVVDQHIAVFNAVQQVARVFELRVQVLKEPVWKSVGV
jgi:hypothetical protein